MEYFSMNSLRFWKLRFPKFYATSDMVYVPINWLLRFWIQNLMRLLMFDELVITISAELKSGFQLIMASIINEVLNLINL